MTLADKIARLREKAKAATPGPWTIAKPERDAEGWLLKTAIAATARRQCIYAPIGSVFPSADQAHIAAFDPPTVLALLDVVEAVMKFRSCTLCGDIPGYHATHCAIAHLDAALEDR